MPGQTSAKPSGYRDRNSTADKALDILLLFRDDKLVWTGAEIAEQLGVARSTGYRYVQSLVGSGFIEEAAGGFRLGPAVLDLARLARRGLGLSETARPVMRRLADDVGETVLLTRRSGAVVVCLELEESRHHVRLSYERGQVLPVNAGAAAQALLAWSPPEEIDEVLAGASLQRFTEGTLTRPEDLRDRLAAIRRRGYAATRGELDEEVTGVAAPVFAADGTTRAAVSVAALTSRLPRTREKAVADAVCAAAREIGDRIAALEA